MLENKLFKDFIPLSEETTLKNLSKVKDDFINYLCKIILKKIL